MPQFTVELQGLPELDRAMRAMVHASDNLRPVFDQIITDFQLVQAASFAAGGLPRKWKRNSRGTKTLVRTGALRRSMTGPGPQLDPPGVRYDAAARLPCPLCVSQ